MVKKTITIFLFLLPIVFIFKNWFIFPFLSAHDFPYFFKETLADFPLFISSWIPTSGMGFGGEPINPGLSSFIYMIVSLFVNTIGLPWELVYRIFIFGLFLFFSIFSSVYLLRTVLNNPGKLQLLLSALIFSANTYILMVMDGGQIGVALAYSLSPLVLARFIKIIHNSKFIIRNSILAALVLAVQGMFDLRIAFLVTVIVLFYTLFHYFFIERFNLKACIIYLLLVGLILLGLNAYWILPIIVFHSYPSGESLGNSVLIEGFQFFSFATFSQTLSLLQPNWPENIFGKVYFMRSEFILLPVLAYLGLLFLKTKALKNTDQYIEQRRILFFALLGLMGAFLAKGANTPIPQINNWLFIHLPFLSLFRDPTKFYLLIALSYSVLIPFSLQQILIRVSSIKYKVLSIKFNIHNTGYIILIAFLAFWLFLIRPVFLNQLSGTFAKHQIPKEYLELKDFLNSQKNFSRTLWIPRQHRYNFYSYLHPAVSGEALFSATNSAEIIRKLKKEQIHKLISDLSIKYIIVPYDSCGEIFVKDRKYNEKEYLATINLLDPIDWLKKNESFGKIAVYETLDYKDHFWIDGKGSLSYTEIDPSKYKLDVSIDKPSSLVFTEAYSPYWVVKTDSVKLTSRRTKNNLNSFSLEKKGTYTLTVYFSKQEYYVYGRIITLFFITILLFTIIYLRKRDNL